MAEDQEKKMNAGDDAISDLVGQQLQAQAGAFSGVAEGAPGNAVRGIGNINLPAIRIGKSTSADGYCTAAADYLTAVLALVDCESVSWRPWGFVTGQTLESTLKAYISRVAGKVAHTHDLEQLWSQAAAASANATNKLAISITPPPWCVWLNELHDDPYRNRYPSEDTRIFQLPTRKQLAEDLRAIVQEVEAAFR